MLETKNIFNIPIIGADAELQARMKAELSASRSLEPRRRVSPRMTTFANNERKHNRYEISNPVVCFPVLEGHEVGSDTSFVGVAADISVTGVRVIIDGPTPYVGLQLVVGVEMNNGSYQFIGGTVTSVQNTAPTVSIVGVEFKGYMHEVLQSELIYPVLDRVDLKYGMPYPDSVLASICKVGAAASIHLDSILICPTCRALPTFRRGCAHCFSTNVRASRMIHHFACANVDFIEKFESDGSLLCQKCRTRDMIVGSDYEYLDGPNMCFDCGEANLEKVLIGHCLCCEHRFNIEQANELEVIGYRVNKLDVLVFIGAIN